MITPDKTPQLWVEQWWQSFCLALIDADSLFRESKYSMSLGAAYAAETHLDRYLQEKNSLGCRSKDEGVWAVRSLMALKYEMRG